MKKIQKLMSFMLMGMLTAACSLKEGDIDFSYQGEKDGVLLGTWNECYNDPGFCFDSSVSYTFQGTETAGTFTVKYVSYLDSDADEYVREGEYTVKDGVLSILYQDEKQPTRYKLVTLGKKEMEWQMEGTKFAQNQYACEYRHFSR